MGKGASNDVRFRSLADIEAPSPHVRFTPESGHHRSAPVARYSYVVLVVMLSSVTVAGPTGTCIGLTIFKNRILSVHTFLRKSSKTLIVNCSAGQRRYPKPNGANPAWSHTGTGLPSTTP